ncbi:hypothetical protein AXFE_29880 [Acidithrix ferrooxidans]|uniref:Uncharacterized protein n=1 Tax=Acidithrix ferrooxidans TaxID=1280514 RepID=A0A0D8HDV2_9ACTN|nr:hypothetical protein AXFE_29880 [Acidithrix ferrooxidans]
MEIFPQIEVVRVGPWIASSVELATFEEIPFTPQNRIYGEEINLVGAVLLDGRGRFFFTDETYTKIAIVSSAPIIWFDQYYILIKFRKFRLHRDQIGANL